MYLYVYYVYIYIPDFSPPYVNECNFFLVCMFRFVSLLYYSVFDPSARVLPLREEGIRITFYPAS